MNHKNLSNAKSPTVVDAEQTITSPLSSTKDQKSKDKTNKSIIIIYHKIDQVPRVRPL